jgi:hypothetical protein
LAEIDAHLQQCIQRSNSRLKEENIAIVRGTYPRYPAGAN